MSAFWHGFYPCYYVSFFFSALICELAKDIYKARFLFSFIPPQFRWIVCNTVTLVTLNFWFVVVSAQRIELCIKFCNATYWIMAIIPITSIIFTRGFGLVRYAKRLEAKQAKVDGETKKT